MNIDWSKAPSWATAVGRRSVSLAWLCDSGYCFHGIANPPCHPYKENSYSADMFTIVERRPWTGEGLPPVGAVCEFKTYGRNTEWSEVEIIAHFLNKAPVAAFIQTGDGHKTVNQAIAECFRPIRTPEQIAAEERTAAIKEMVSACPYPGSNCTATDCAALYDAGYRKQVSQ